VRGTLVIEMMVGGESGVQVTGKGTQKREAEGDTKERERCVGVGKGGTTKGRRGGYYGERVVCRCWKRGRNKGIQRGYYGKKSDV
jgi:hypothetical protein